MLKKSYVSQPHLDAENSKTYAFGKINAVILDDIDNNGFIDLVTFPSNFTVGTPLAPVVWTNTNGIFTSSPNKIKNVESYQYFRDNVSGDFNNDGYTDYFQIDQGWELNNRNPDYFFGSQPALLLGGSQDLTWQPISGWLTNSDGGKSFNHIGDSADYDGDGDLDVVVASFWDFRIYENSGSAKFTWQENLLPAKFNNGSYSVSGTTFIELGGQYAVVAGAYRIFSLSEPVLPLSVLTQQNGQFTESYTLSRPNLGHNRERNYGAADMFNMDLNGDGREDLLVLWETEPSGGINDGLSNMSGSSRVSRYQDISNSIISIYFQDETGKLVSDGTFYNGPKLSSAAPLYFEDFNLDGHMDFWMSSFHSHPSNFNELVFINDGNGRFSNPINMFSIAESFPDWYLLSPFFVDANNDGAIDVVAIRPVYPEPPTRTIGEEVRVFLSETPGYDLKSNNKFSAVLADKMFDGGAGTDTAIFSGKFSDYKIEVNKNGHWITTDQTVGRDGTDVWINVERFKFDDLTVAIDINNGAGQVYRMYKAALNRAPDQEGLGYWINQFDNGASLKNIAGGFVDSTEFRNKFYGDGTNTTFVGALYNNILGRAPEQEGYDYWLNLLDQGVDRASVLIGFSESPENYSNTADLIAKGIVYQEWTL